jgi:endonuclease YncB( thermonuclease family)
MFVSGLIILASVVVAQTMDAPAFIGAAESRTIRGTAKVIDGDTIDVAGTRVRLKGIAAPEGKEPGGAEAKAALAKMIGKGQVSCTFTGEKTHGRDAGYCYDANGADLNGKMVALPD